MRRILVIDTSSLIALERIGILNKLKYVDFEIVIPHSVFLELGKIKQENTKKSAKQISGELGNRGFPVSQKSKRFLRMPEIQRIPGHIRIENLKGRSIKKVKSLISKGFGNGEAECLVLADKLKINFIISDDRKFLRQKYMLEDKILKDIEIAGFSFIIHVLFKKKQINDVWKTFDDVIEKNNWKRSEVEAANFVFLKEMGY